MADSLPRWAPEGVDLTTASSARMYDYFLGGAHNFGVDRDLARKALEFMPDIPIIAQANRAFLHRAVTYLLDRGVRQFIDIGSGIPTIGNVHDTAQLVDPESRVLYVDHDPVAVAHSQLILDGVPNTAVLQGDLRRPKEILQSPDLRDLIDLSQPVGLLMVAVLHFVSADEQPGEAIEQFRDSVAPGSYLAISHASNENRVAEAGRLEEIFKSAADKGTMRSRPQIESLFEGWDLVEPGLVWVPLWRPRWPDEVGRDPALSVNLAGVALRA